VKTSKIAVYLWLLIGAAYLLFGHPDSLGLGLWICGLAAVTWNRLDSRGKGYEIALSGPGGVKAHIKGTRDVPTADVPTAIDPESKNFPARACQAIPWRVDRAGKPKAGEIGDGPGDPMGRPMFGDDPDAV
jgi:hypothetical protein